MPRRIEALAHEHVSAIAAGQMHSLVKTREGRVYTFGSGFGGKLGHSSRHNQLLPKLVEGLEGMQGIAAAGNVSWAWRNLSAKGPERKKRAAPADGDGAEPAAKKAKKAPAKKKKK